MNMPSHLLRLLSAVAVVVLLASGVTACGDSDDGSGDGTPAASTPDTSDRSADTPPSEDGDGASEEGASPSGGTNDGAAADPSSAGEQAPDDVAGAGDETDEGDRVRAVVTGMYSDFAAGDAAGVCSVMTDSAQEQIARSTVDSKSASCKAGLGNFLAAAQRSGALKQAEAVRVGSVDVKGDTATATITLSGRTGTIQLIKENGSWRFGSTPVGAQPAK
jgi:ketosteroid isomerase-like protein